MVRGVDHVAIAARDPRALTQWYCEALGLRILFDNGQDPPTFLVGGTDGGMLEIMPDNGADRVAHHPFDPGIRHIALRVDDFDAAHAALAGRAMGVTPAAPAAGGGRVAFFHDPEGNLLQIVSRDRELL